MVQKTYYEILGVSPEASQEEIESQGHFWIQAWHPDKFRNPEEKKRAEEMFKEVDEAYRTLRDPVKRSSYDWQIKVGTAKGNLSASATQRTSTSYSYVYPSPFFAMLFSLVFFGGGGQIYIGQVAKGIIIIIVTFFLLLFGIGVILWIIACIDAYQLAKRKQSGENIGLWQWFWN